ncbi:hypothetical protein AUJ62_00845 [Candidatus Pacearchaeota archaeon CG1_02_32_21]|nr:MAG: hypothetical protein AUJ62_00845 [Candidatus Pacearchaeota archaeon CG1_02_32_21]
MGEWTDWDLKTLNKIYKSLSEESGNRRIDGAEALMLRCMVFNPSEFLEDLWSAHLEGFVTDETHYYLEKRGHTHDKNGYFDDLSHEEYKDARGLILGAVALKSEIIEEREAFLDKLREKGGLLGYVVRLDSANK